MKKILFIFGTRPEAIKMAPLIHQMKQSDNFITIVCSTGQHREMLDQALDFFRLRPDYDLNIMRSNQNLYNLTTSILESLRIVLDETNPDLVFIQGDTTTTMIGALCSFYNKIEIAHLEAGLRSYNKFSPYPEEMNRILTSHLADYHFAPTDCARNNLIAEGVSSERIYVVGNTVIDALFWGLKNIENLAPHEIDPALCDIDFSKKVILVTVHRRESFGDPLLNICYALKEISRHNHVEIVYPVHLNPNVKDPVFSILGGKSNIHLLHPVNYSTMLYLMKKSYIILTDSGGIQEEAPSLNKPVLVLREVTERIEGVAAGVTKLVGTSKEKIIRSTFSLLDNIEEYNQMASGSNPYGDGFASQRILEILRNL